MTPVGPNTSPSDIYCKHCGYDLRAPGDAKRCPECGRAFSPDDPKTFRSRPFAAPWKRALGVWAKRGAILLLVLAVLLGGVWGWYYWGWRQEQAALLQMRATFFGYPLKNLPKNDIGWHISVPTWDGSYAPYARRLGPPAFVFDRVFQIGLSENATDADLLPLRHLHDLQCLSLDSTKITDAGLSRLPSKQLPRLSSLELGETAITDAALIHLAELPALENLYLTRTRITDPGLAHLEKLPALRTLGLELTAITDAGLVHLEKLTELKTLDLSGTKVTPAGVTRLKAALPGCTIYGP